MENFNIKTEIFEGPLDLLLSLIEKRKLLINEVSLSKITDDYISHVKDLPNYSLYSRANFIVIASTLLLVKSRSLLPGLTLSDDEEESIDDLRRRLKLYQRIKELSLHIKDMYGKNPIFFADYKSSQIKVFSPHEKITKDSLAEALKALISRLPKVIENPEVIVKKVISLEEMMDRLTDRIQGAIKMSFKEFSGKGKVASREDKIDVIVSFLAMLELVKQGALEVRQEINFDEIEMETTSIGIPRYG